MTAVGGSIESVSIRGRNFPATADADATRKLGGFEAAIEANGDGTARKVKTRVAWRLGGIVLEVDDDRADQEFLNEIAASNDFEAITITLASGHTYQGRGTVAGEIDFNTMNSTATVELSGPGELTQQ